MLAAIAANRTLSLCWMDHLSSFRESVDGKNTTAAAGVHFIDLHFVYCIDSSPRKKRQRDKVRIWYGGHFSIIYIDMVFAL